MPNSEELERRTALLELTTDLVSSATPEGRITYLNRGGFELLGWDPRDGLEGRRIPDVHPEWAGRLIVEHGLPVAMRDGIWEAETAVLREDGTEIPVSQVIVAHRDGDGEVVHLSTIMRDIRDRKRIEQDLRESSRMLQLVMDFIPQFVFWKDSDSVYQGCNRNFAEVAGVGAVEEIVGKTDYDLAWKKEEADFFRQVDAEVMGSGEPQTHIVEPQLQADGKEAWLDTSKIPLHDDDGRVVGILGMYEDITDRKKAEEAMLQNQKLESLGQLAGGVAHDFNNMLAAIRGAAELLSLDPEDADFRLRLIQEILDASDHAAGLTQRLLDFARKGRHVREPVDVRRIVESSVALLGRTLDRKIGIEAEANASNHTVLGDPSQLQNLLLNLGLNARDAMPDGGSLTIATREVDLTGNEPTAAPFEIEPGAYLEISVRDTGVGMPPETAEKAFEPFFTTKEVGAGTGLGLSVVYSTVMEHGGAIRIDSEPGVGTTVTIALPLAATETSETEPIAEAKSVGTARILVADDEDLVREVVGMMLSTLGYEAVLAEDGVEAIEIFQRERDRIDLVLLDMVMPRMNGRETLDALRAIAPSIPVIFASGFAREETDVADANVQGLLRKPYQMADLARLVEEALSRGR